MEHKKIEQLLEALVIMNKLSNKAIFKEIPENCVSDAITYKAAIDEVSAIVEEYEKTRISPLDIIIDTVNDQFLTEEEKAQNIAKVFICKDFKIFEQMIDIVDDRMSTPESQLVDLCSKELLKSKFDRS